MYLTAAAERLAPATLQVHLAAIVTAHRLVGLSLDPGHPSIALLLDGIRRRKGTRPSRQATPISPAMLARMVNSDRWHLQLLNPPVGTAWMTSLRLLKAQSLALSHPVKRFSRTFSA
jgi:hypothetical protein